MKAAIRNVAMTSAALAVLLLAACDASTPLDQAQPATGAELEKLSATVHKPAKIGTHAALIQLFCQNMSGAPCPADTEARLQPFGFTDGATGVDLAHAFIKMAADAKDGSADMQSSDPDFIAAAYRVVLNREPDPPGAEHYAKLLAEKPGEDQRKEMILILLKSPEFKFRGK